MPETVHLDLLIKDMQLDHNHMVIVVNEYGETSGIVTMEDILEEIVAHKREEVAQFRQLLPLRQLAGLTEPMLSDPVPSMREALMASPTGIIAEFKRKSPSKGWIHREAKADVVSLAYQQAGASAVSVLTDRNYFGGYDEFIQMARASGVTLPILYKNFVIDEYQLFQARHCGASAVLLIAAALKLDTCRQLIALAHDLGLEVLLELHDERDLDHAELEPDLYGVNNRHLGTFVTDVQTSFQMAERLPHTACKVSESGIADAATVLALRQAGYRGFLIGESLMRESYPGEALARLVAQMATPETENQ